MAHSGSGWLAMAVWAAGGVFALLATVSIAELAVLIPNAGGFYNYARAAWGNAAGLTVGWIDGLCQISALAYGAVTASDLLEKLGWNFRGSSIVLILLIAGIQWLGIRSASRVQEVISFFLALAYLGMAIIALAVPAAHVASTSSFSHAGGFVAWIVVMRSVIVTYDGWYGPIYFAEEVRQPHHDLPKSMIQGVVAVIAIYLFINMALIRSLGENGLAASSFPAIDAARHLFGVTGERAITVVSLIAMPSLMNSVLLFATRILYAMSRDGLMHRSGAFVSAKGTPVVSLFAATIIALVLATTRTFEHLLALAAFLYAAVYCTGFAALFSLRRKMPAANRKFRSWFYPWGTAAVLAVCLAFLASDVVGQLTK